MSRIGKKPVELPKGVTLDGTFFVNNNGGVAAFEAGFAAPIP